MFVRDRGNERAFREIQCVSALHHDAHNISPIESKCVIEAKCRCRPKPFIELRIEERREKHTHTMRLIKVWPLT